MFALPPLEFSSRSPDPRPPPTFPTERAERWCAACHVVSLDQRQASSDAPPFEEIARRPNFSEPGMMTFLLDPHAKMPNMNLTRGDIAAYIKRLR